MGSFSFMGISQSLPTTSYMKWIDFWMMFSIIMPFLEVLAQAGNYMLRGNTIKISNSTPSCFPVFRFNNLCGTNEQTWTGASEVNWVI